MCMSLVITLKFIFANCSADHTLNVLLILIYFIICHIFTEVKDLTSVAEVQALRESVYATLEEHVKRVYHGDGGRFAKLLLRLPALRSIGR